MKGRSTRKGTFLPCPSSSNSQAVHSSDACVALDRTRLYLWPCSITYRASSTPLLMHSLQPKHSEENLLVALNFVWESPCYVLTDRCKESMFTRWTSNFRGPLHRMKAPLLVVMRGL